ncbi:MAG: hypothetical protein Q9227_004506 [Pyrenula ochraceoflavens]
MLENARDLTVEAAHTAAASRSSRSGSSRTIPAAQVKKLLDSRTDREILDGLRRVTSLMYRSQPCLTYFSAVVKNVANPNFEIKKLVYLYLLNYAESEPDLALLSINAIQKSLTDSNPQVRALALRTMSGIRVPVISQIVSLAIKRGCGDMSPLVRKAAALAIPKCYRLDPNTLPQLLEYLATLLGDKQYFVAGPAVTTFLEMCPTRIDLIHPHYRSLVRKLVDMDEWSQLSTLRVLSYYSRRCFPRRTATKKVVIKKGFYEDEDDQEQETDETVHILDPDLDLFLRACKPLLQSRNPAVILNVVRCFIYLGTEEHISLSVEPLIILLRGPSDIVPVALYNIVAMALIRPTAFGPHAAHFFVRSSDPPHVWRLKIEILTLLFAHVGKYVQSLILDELEHFCHSANVDLVHESVQAIGRCAQSVTDASSRCFNVLLKQISSTDDNLVSVSLTVVRHLIQQSPTSHQSTVVRLAQNLDTITNPVARANIIWLVGEYSGLNAENNIAPDVLRILTKNFPHESEAAKQQIILLAAKVYLIHLQSQDEPPASADDTPQQEPYEILQDQSTPTQDSTSPIPILWQYILHLARYDTSYDIRDRARLLKSLLATPSSTQLASLLLQAPKPVPFEPSPSASRKGILLGTSTLVVGPEGGFKGLPGYEELPDWVAEGEEPDSALRAETKEIKEYGEGKSVSVSASERLEEAVRERGKQGQTTGAGKASTLDDWLDEEESEEEETESESESEEGSEESSEEESGDEEEVEETSGEEGDASPTKSGEAQRLMTTS